MKPIIHQFFLSVFLLFFATISTATELMPLEKAFQLKIADVETHSIQLSWDIADGYFVFDNRLRVESNTDGIKIGELGKPKSDTIKDGHFGELNIYRQQLVLNIPLIREDKAQNELNLGVSYQGCKTTKDCYPLQNVSLHFSLPPLDVKQDFDFPEKTDEFLDPEVAFLFSAELAEDKSYIIARWKIAEGYYLYRKQLSFTIENAPQVLGEMEIPDGVMKEDEYFGRVEVYFDSLEVKLLLKNTKNLSALVLNVGYRGCAEGGLCYPATQKKQTLALTSSKPLEMNQFSNSGAVDNGVGNAFGNDNFLPPEEAFQLDVNIEDQKTLIAHWQIADNYYVYRDKLKFKILDGGELGEVELPPGKSKDDPQFGTVDVYYSQVAVRLPLRNAGEQVKLAIEYQGCAEAGLCYPPETKVLDINLPTAEIRAASLPEDDETDAATTSDAATAPTQVDEANLSEQDKIQKFLGESNFFVILAAFFGFGLLLALTPCVFPMIPILSGIIVGQGKDITPYKGFMISLVYVLAMALTYTVAGVVAGLLGANLQIAFQNPWLLSTFALIFVLLSLSMFGFYELQMPSALQSRLNDLSNRQEGGTFIGVAVMGLLSALIVGPCIAPPLAGALMFISSTGNAALGGAALFFMSLGMGVPLLLIGLSAGKLLPRAGTWMDIVKYVFGVLLLAVAVWMMERVLPIYVTMLMWATLLIVSAVYMGALDKVEGGGWHKLWKGLGFLLLVYGILLVIGVARGHYDVFKPLAGLSASAGGETAGATGGGHALDFQLVNSLAELDVAVEKAAAQNKPVMLDFYADWCIACKELEKFTFTDAGVQAALADYVLLQADVTDYNADHKALLKHFNLYGPPGIIFYNRQGIELSASRVVGFKNASDFTNHIKQLP